MLLNRLFSIGLFCGLTAMTSSLLGGVPLAVKRGQASVDAKTLPFVCFAVVTEGLRSPIEKIVFKEIDSGQSYTASLGKTFDPEHPDYFVAMDARKRIVALLVLRLAAGTYDIQSIEFTPLHAATTTWLTLDYSKGPRCRFTIQPDVVNYVGSVIISVPIGQGGLPAPGVARSFVAMLDVASTQKRDIKWAAEMAPALASLPSTTSDLKMTPSEPQH